jgi:hypothetical protein
MSFWGWITGTNDQAETDAGHIANLWQRLLNDAAALPRATHLIFSH